MVDVAVTSVPLVNGVMSADILVPTEGSTEVEAAEFAVITPAAGAKHSLMFVTLHEDGGGAATVTPVAGDKPPSMRQGVAAVAALDVPTNDCVILALDPSEYMQDDGTYRLLVGGNTLDIGAFTLPVLLGGG